MIDTQRKKFVPEYKLEIYKKTIESLVNKSIKAVQDIIENGQNGRKNSFIDVEHTKDGDDIILKKLTYRSTQPSIEENIIYKK